MIFSACIKIREDKRIPDLETYLKINAITYELRLYDINATSRIKEGMYFARLEEKWIPLEAGESYLCTSGKQIRALYLNNSGIMCEKILLLEACLKNCSDYIEMRSYSGEFFEVMIKSNRVSSSLYVSGEFLHKGYNEEFQCQLMLQSGKKIIGVAMETKLRGLRELNVNELSIEDKFQLIQDV